MRTQLFSATRSIVSLSICLLMVAGSALHARHDLVFADYTQNNSVCLNDGTGSFTCTSVSRDTNFTLRVAVGDFDGTNGLDLAFVKEARDRAREITTPGSAA